MTLSRFLLISACSAMLALVTNSCWRRPRAMGNGALPTIGAKGAAIGGLDSSSTFVYYMFAWVFGSSTETVFSSIPGPCLQPARLLAFSIEA